MDKRSFKNELVHFHVPAEIVERAGEIFEKAQRNENQFCLMGRIDDLKSIVGFEKSGSFVQVEGTEICNFRFTDDIQSGNVQNVTGWKLTYNDAWLYGGIVGNSTFNFVSNGAVNIENFFEKYGLTGDTRYPVTVTIREIIGLLINGYIPYIHQSGALLFQKDSQAKTQSLEEYYQELEKYGLNEGNTPTDDQMKQLSKLVNNYIRAARKFPD